MTTTTTESINGVMATTLFIQAGLLLLYLIRTRIPVVFCRLSALFWGLSCAWDRLWEVYADTLQRSTELRSTGRSAGDPPR